MHRKLLRLLAILIVAAPFVAAIDLFAGKVAGVDNGLLHIFDHLSSLVTEALSWLGISIISTGVVLSFWLLLLIVALVMVVLL